MKVLSLILFCLFNVNVITKVSSDSLDEFSNVHATNQGVYFDKSDDFTISKDVSSDDHDDDFHFDGDDDDDDSHERHLIFGTADSKGRRIDGKNDAESDVSYDAYDLCKNVRCSKHERCVIKNDHIALCMKKKQKNKLGSQSSVMKKGKSCKPCPATSPKFVCGSDNRTYSSSCHLDYRNCIHNDKIIVKCMEFCPCSDDLSAASVAKQKKKSGRWNRMMNKYRSTVEKNKNEDNNDVFTHYKKYQHKKLTSKWKVSNRMKKQKNKGFNSILKKKSHHKVTYTVNECTDEELRVMGNRLLDWFSVIKSNSKVHQKLSNKSDTVHKNKVKFPRCMKEVHWMFGYLDKNKDGKLSLKELYNLEHDQHEHCIKPFLDKCDSNSDIFLHPYEWCKCFDVTERPCAAARSQSRHLLGSYIPDCDEHGFYKQMQCHSSIGMCWCVDKHGIEFLNTRSRGRKDCDSLVNKTFDDDDVDDDDVVEGSGDLSNLDDY